MAEKRLQRGSLPDANHKPAVNHKKPTRRVLLAEDNEL